MPREYPEDYLLPQKGNLVLCSQKGGKLFYGFLYFFFCLFFSWIAIEVTPRAELFVAISAYAFAAFFGYGATLYFLGGLLPNTSFLRLTPQGFLIVTPTRRKSFDWGQVAQFHAGTISSNFITFEVVRFKYNGGSFKRPFWKETVLIDTYGVSHQKLAWALNLWREEYGKDTNTIRPVNYE